MPDALTDAIIGAAIEVHRCLGPGLLESIYEEALTLELQMRGLQVQRQVEMNVFYKGHAIRGQRLDMLVAGEVVVELKSVANLPDIAVAQVMSYLKATGLQRGLLINFGRPRLIEGVKRLSNFEAQQNSERSVISVASS